jgi:hypothetical protein
MNRHWSFIGLLAFVAFAPGCGPAIQELCEEQESCLGGNDADIDACVASYDGARDNAYDIGCGDEYDLLINCISPQYECFDGMTCSSNDECGGSACVRDSCKSYGVDSTNADACEAEVNAYSRCD